ncbi:DinB family protein [soil metagenome]
MIGVDYVRGMARYNRWQNANLYEAADRLSDGERHRDRGAFFGSIHGTLSHLVWADRLWMARFCDSEAPPVGIAFSPALHPDWRDLKRARSEVDDGILRWSESLDAGWLEGELRYFSQSLGRDNVGPRGPFVVHFFNHQTHHRGQVHCLLTQAGASPRDDTDLVMMPR